MTQDMVVDIVRLSLITLIKSAAPMLLISLLIGLIVSIFQTVTSIQEQTLTFVPKLLGVFLILILFGSWILNNLSSLMIELISNLNIYIGKT